MHECGSASTSSHFAMDWGVGGLDKPEEGKLLPALWWCLHSPCLSHQHWPEPTADPAVTCGDGEGRNGNYLYKSTSHFALCRVPGTAKCFNRPNPPCQPGASALASLDEPQVSSICLIMVRVWPWLNQASGSQRFIHVLHSALLSSPHRPAWTSCMHMYKCLQNWVPGCAEHCTKRPPLSNNTVSV